MCSGSQVGSYLRLIDSCITQLKAQGLSGPVTRLKKKRQKKKKKKVKSLGAGFITCSIEH